MFPLDPLQVTRATTLELLTYLLVVGIHYNKCLTLHGCLQNIHVPQLIDILKLK